MAVKFIEISDIGRVKLSKRRGTRHLRLRATSGGGIVVSIPAWIPFKAGEKFALQHIEWIKKHRTQLDVLLPNRKIGRNHTLSFKVGAGVKPAVKVGDSDVVVSVPVGMTVKSPQVQTAAIRGAKKALKSQVAILEDRLESISKITKLKYKSSRYGFMKTRWGSCKSDMTITLNYHLLNLPVEQINYVIIHELVHTKHLNHSPDFWSLVESFEPNYKQLRKEVKIVKLGW